MDHHVAHVATVRPAVLEPGSPAQIEADVRLAQRAAAMVEQDARPLVRYLQNLRNGEAWARWLPDEPKTWRRFCEEALGYEAAFLSEIEDGVAVLERDGRQGPITANDARKAALKQHRRPSMQEQDKGNNYYLYSPPRRGTDPVYLRARLERDHHATGRND